MYVLKSGRGKFAAACSLLLLAVLLMLSWKGFQPKGDDLPEGVLKSMAEENWTKLFERTEGWLGADGIYSIPLNGVDSPASATDGTKTLFVFSDT